MSKENCKKSGRKRKRCEEEWQKNKDKVARNEVNITRRIISLERERGAQIFVLR